MNKLGANIIEETKKIPKNTTKTKFMPRYRSDRTCGQNESSERGGQY
jgi:hypothetical protein